MKIIHVARLYGPVGGMERYVWELTHRMRDLGHEVIILCQACLAEKPEGIAVYELGLMAKRPRWLSYLRFDKKIRCWLKQNPHTDAVIHSHERLSMHHVTTFHGPPFANVLNKPWYKLLSVRIWVQLYLEKRELSITRFIVPNSETIKIQLADYYPKFAHKLTQPIVPGVNPPLRREPRLVPKDGGVVGFMGVEWKRKGLAFAVEIIAKLRKTRPNLQFQVVGAKVSEVAHLFVNLQDGYTLLGWSNEDYYAKFDVLLHPARVEPYGMVISEAMAACLPVVISDVCGAAPQVVEKAGAVLPLNASIDDWCQALNEQLDRATPPPRFERSWQTVAEEYIKIYNIAFDSLQ